MESKKVRSKKSDTYLRIARKVGIFFISLFFFILALGLMRKGARGLEPLLQGSFQLSNAWNSWGFGWLGAYIIMSGSPVAASAITFLDAGILTPFQTFTMISGSRFGSSFIVLFIGFIYILRGKDRASSLSMGLLSLLVTATLHTFILILGLWLIKAPWLLAIKPGSGGMLMALTTMIIDPVVNFLDIYLPTWGMFVVGMGVILGSFQLFDQCLPEMTIKESQVGLVGRVVYRPIVMFALGFLVTLVSMSVSVSLSILVPLSQRGFIRRENVIPYIMGANISTFIDTLFAAMLAPNSPAFTVVFAQMVGVVIVSMFFFLTILRPYERGVLRVVSWITETNSHLAFFMVTIIIIPIVLLLV